MRYATTTMLGVQLPFPVDDIDDFWRNHKIRNNLDDIVTKSVPNMLKWTFEDREFHTITVYYKDQEATIPEDNYSHWRACWWVLRGSRQAREKLGLDMFDDIPTEEYPKIEEI